MDQTQWQTDGSRSAPDLDDPQQWTRIVETVSVPGLLAAIEAAMGPGLLAKLTPEDLLQETLLQAWRDRRAHHWQGLRPFRAWLLAIAENRIRDASDQLGALKRGGDRQSIPLAGPGDSAGGSPGWSPQASTTPSRSVMHRERARAMVAALARLPETCREIVRLRIFGQMSVERIAETLGLSPAAVRHRLRSGAERYLHMLRGQLSRSVSPESSSHGGPDTAVKGSDA